VREGRDVLTEYAHLFGQVRRGDILEERRLVFNLLVGNGRGERVVEMFIFGLIVIVVSIHLLFKFGSKTRLIYLANDGRSIGRRGH
jgi:hypothetical protein